MEIVKDLYRDCPLTVDDLPYTTEFDRMHAAFVKASGKAIDRHDLWRILSGLRKGRRLPRKIR